MVYYLVKGLEQTIDEAYELLFDICCNYEDELCKEDMLILNNASVGLNRILGNIKQMKVLK